MKTNRPYCEDKIYKKYKDSFDFVKSQKSIQERLSSFGYTAELIAEGQSLLHETAKAMKEKKIRYNKRSEAYQAFTSVYNELSESFRLHKSIANVVFRTDKKSLVKLTGMNFASKNYEKSMEQISTFYTLSRSNTEVQSKLARLRLTPEKLDLVKDLIPSVEAARANYINEKAKSKDATKIKNIALAKMTYWMQEFYAVAKLAIEDQTLLEKTLGKTVEA
jgi:hypothetical protein